jgi:glutathione S-transferase
MIDYRPLQDIIDHRGLRLVLVRGMPSPWGQGAKALFENKGLDFVVGAQDPGGLNDELYAWSGQRSGPVVAWADEKPIDRWIDIVMLADRLEPARVALSQDPAQRALTVGLLNEICGEGGIGWNRRLQMFAPAIESGGAPEGVARMAARYGYRKQAAAECGERTAGQLRLLAAQLRSQYARGVKYFVGDGLSALDLYWVTFMNLLVPLPQEQCAIPEGWRPAFEATDPVILGALDPLLVEHRDRIFAAHFKNPMEL